MGTKIKPGSRLTPTGGRANTGDCRMNDLSNAVVIDLESTGLDPAEDRITSIALLAYDEAGLPGLPFAALVNPMRPIPEKVSRLTGLTDTTVASAPPFSWIAERVAELIRDRPLIGFGIRNFDLPMLAEEFERASVPYSFGPVIDAGAIYKKQESRTLAAAVRFYLGRELAHAHTAMADAEATRQVLAAQLQLYTLPVLARDLATYSVLSEHAPADPFGKLVWIDGRICFNLHSNRGVAVEDDPGYAEWMLRRDFPLATNSVLRAELDRLNSQPPAGTNEVSEPGEPGEEVEIPF